MAQPDDADVRVHLRWDDLEQEHVGAAAVAWTPGDLALVAGDVVEDLGDRELLETDVRLLAVRLGVEPRLEDEAVFVLVQEGEGDELGRRPYRCGLDGGGDDPHLAIGEDVAGAGRVQQGRQRGHDIGDGGARVLDEDLGRREQGADLESVAHHHADVGSDQTPGPAEAVRVGVDGLRGEVGLVAVLVGDRDGLRQPHGVVEVEPQVEPGRSVRRRRADQGRQLDGRLHRRRRRRPALPAEETQLLDQLGVQEIGPALVVGVVTRGDLRGGRVERGGRCDVDRAEQDPGVGGGGDQVGRRPRRRVGRGPEPRSDLGDPHGEDPVEGGRRAVGGQLVRRAGGGVQARCAVGAVRRQVGQRPDGVGDPGLVGGRLRQAGYDAHGGQQAREASVGVPPWHRRTVEGQLHVPGVTDAGGDHGLVAARARLAGQGHQVVEALGVGGADVDRDHSRVVDVRLGDGVPRLLLDRQPGTDARALVAGDDDLAAPLVDGHPGADGDLEVRRALDRGDRDVQAVGGAVPVEGSLVEVVLRQVVQLLLEELVESEDHAVGVVDPLVGGERA